MRHKKRNHQRFGRKVGHRRALERSLINQLLTHERIVTTVTKAKVFRPEAEKIITLAKKAHLAVQAAEGGDAEAKAEAQRIRLRYIRLALSRLDKRKLYDRDGDPVLTENRRIRTIIQKLFDDLGPRYAKRPGGYTRILRLPGRRIGDGAERALWELVDREGEIGPPPEPEKKGKKKRRRRKKKAAAATATSDD